MEMEFHRAARVRRLSMTVNGVGRVVVRIPLKMPQKTVDAFIASPQAKAWLQKATPIVARRQAVYDITPDELLRVRRAAEAYIPQRVAALSARTGLVPKAVKIRKLTGCLGKCSRDDTLTFSLYLMRYPEGVLDCVILHELCHIKHKNHGREFYALLSQYCPDYKKYDKML